MKTSDGRSPAGHPEDLLLGYVEGVLSEKDRSRVEEHLDSCAECRTEVVELKKMIAALKTSKEAICPEPWQLHDFFQRHEDPEGRIADHVRGCPLCRRELDEFQKSCDESAVPESIGEVFRKYVAESRGWEAVKQRQSPIARLVDAISRLLPVPALALGTAAAAVLLVILLYPGAPTRPLVGLSDVTWQDGAAQRLKPKGLHLMGPSGPSAVPDRPRPRVAVILLFSGFEQPWPQQTVDSLYRSLTPSREIARRVELTPPSTVKQTLGALTPLPSDPAAVANTLTRQLNLSGVLCLTITSADRGYRIEGDMTSAATGRLVRREKKEVTLPSDLPNALRDLAVGLLKQSFL